MCLVVRDDTLGQQAHKGVKIWHKLFFTENTENMVTHFLHSAGAESHESFQNLDEIAFYIKGKPIRVKVKVSEYEGVPRNEVTRVL
jgi:hypothetical protein